MIILGIVLLVLGFLLGIYLLWILGIILLIVGVALVLASAAGHAAGGRRHWF